MSPDVSLKILVFLLFGIAVWAHQKLNQLSRQHHTFTQVVMHQLKSAYDRIAKLESVGTLIEERPKVQKDEWALASEMIQITQEGNLARAAKLQSLQEGPEAEIVQVIWNVDVPVETRVSRAREWIASDSNKEGIEKVLQKMREPEVHVEFAKETPEVAEPSPADKPDVTEPQVEETTVPEEKQAEPEIVSHNEIQDEKPVIDVEEMPKKKPAKKKIVKKKTFPKAPVMEL